MALSLAEQHTLAADNAFVDRVEQAIIASAIAISQEQPATASHERRAALAYQVLHNSRTYAYRFAAGLVTHGSATTSPPDSGILSFTAALWNAYAGVNPNATVQVAEAETLQARRKPS